MLAVHHSVPTRPLSVSTNIQAVAAIVQLGPTRLTVCSVYLPPGNSLPVTELRQLVLELPPPVLLLGDFNSHHTVWGCDSIDRRGRLLEAFIRDECLCLLNTGMRTHITLPSGQTSALDLSIASPQLVPSITWAVDGDPMGSDHFPIWLRFQSSAVLGERPPRWNLQKADWAEFEAYLGEAFSPERSNRAPLSVADFTSRLIEAAEQFVPRTSGAPRRAPVPWWSDKCRDAILARKRAMRAFQRNSNTANMIAFKKARAFARRTIKDAKRTSWQNYISELNRFTPISEVWSRIKRIAGRSCSAPLPVLKVGGRDILHPAEVAEEIGRALCERSCANQSDTRFMRYRSQCEAVGVDFRTSEQFSYNDPFTLPELKFAISSLRCVAEGPDAVHNVMLRHLPQTALEAMLSLFNSLWSAGTYPDAWREATVIPLLKAGKSGHEPLHYRPISLTSSLGKLMEKLVNTRLTWFLEFEFEKTFLTLRLHTILHGGSVSSESFSSTVSVAPWGFFSVTSCLSDFSGSELGTNSREDFSRRTVCHRVASLV